MPDNVTTLVTPPPVADLKKKLHDALLRVCAVCDEIEAAGYEVGYGTGHGPMKTNIITQLRIMKVL